MDLTKEEFIERLKNSSDWYIIGMGGAGAAEVIFYESGLNKSCFSPRLDSMSKEEVSAFTDQIWEAAGCR